MTAIDYHAIGRHFMQQKVPERRRPRYQQRGMHDGHVSDLLAAMLRQREARLGQERLDERHRSQNAGPKFGLPKPLGSIDDLDAPAQSSYVVSDHALERYGPLFDVLRTFLGATTPHYTELACPATKIAHPHETLLLTRERVRAVRQYTHDWYVNQRIAELLHKDKEQFDVLIRGYTFTRNGIVGEIDILGLKMNCVGVICTDVELKGVNSAQKRKEAVEQMLDVRAAFSDIDEISWRSMYVHPVGGRGKDRYELRTEPIGPDEFMNILGIRE